MLRDISLFTFQVFTVASTGNLSPHGERPCSSFSWSSNLAVRHLIYTQCWKSSFLQIMRGGYLPNYLCVMLTHGQWNILPWPTVESYLPLLHDRKWASPLGLSGVYATIWNNMSRGRQTGFPGLHHLPKLASVGDFFPICQEIHLQTISFFRLSVYTFSKRAESIKLLYLYIFVLLSSSL